MQWNDWENSFEREERERLVNEIADYIEVRTEQDPHMEPPDEDTVEEALGYDSDLIREGYNEYYRRLTL